MEILVIWMLFGLIGIAIAVKKRLNPAVAFLGGVLFAPLSFLIA